jgi:hypothetical protein
VQKDSGAFEENLQRVEKRLELPGPISRRRIAREFGWTEKATEEAFRELARRRLLELAAQEALHREDLIRRTARLFRGCFSQKLVERLRAALLREGVLTKLPRKQLHYRPDAPKPLIEALGLKLEATPSPPSREDLPRRILAKVAELEEAPYVPVIVDRIRPVFSDCNKEEFDRAVLRLAEEGRIYLVPVRVLQPGDREMLIYDGKGNYYASLGLRR